MPGADWSAAYHLAVQSCGVHSTGYLPHVDFNSSLSQVAVRMDYCDVLFHNLGLAIIQNEFVDVMLPC